MVLKNKGDHSWNPCEGEVFGRGSRKVQRSRATMDRALILADNAPSKVARKLHKASGKPRAALKDVRTSMQYHDDYVDAEHDTEMELVAMQQEQGEQERQLWLVAQAEAQAKFQAEQQRLSVEKKRAAKRQRRLKDRRGKRRHDDEEEEEEEEEEELAEQQEDDEIPSDWDQQSIPSQRQALHDLVEDDEPEDLIDQPEFDRLIQEFRFGDELVQQICKAREVLRQYQIGQRQDRLRGRNEP